MKYLFAAAFIAICSSCSTNYKSVRGKVTYLNYPDYGIVNTVNIGDTLLVKAKEETREGYRLNNTVSGNSITLGQGDYFLKLESRRHKYYFPVNPDMIWTKYGSDPNIALAIRKKDNRVTAYNFHSVHTKLDQVPDITEKTVSLVNDTHFKQELIFNGKTGNIARFLYREYTGNLARPAFRQELTYDLAKSTDIGFKEVRIKILKTTNTTITYKVLSGFKDRY